jgi:hypothetical protein
MREKREPAVRLFQDLELARRALAYPPDNQQMSLMHTQRFVLAVLNHLPFYSALIALASLAAPAAA